MSQPLLKTRSRSVQPESRVLIDELFDADYLVEAEEMGRMASEGSYRVADILESQISSGKMEPLSLTITDYPTILTRRNTTNMPWTSFTIYNDGVDPIYITINGDFVQTHTPINAGESVAVDMHIRQIEKVVLVCATGNTANVRVFAMG